MTDTLTRSPARARVRSSGAALPALAGLEMRKSLSTRSGKSLAVASVVLAPVATALAATTADAIGSAAGPIGAMGMFTALVLLSLGVVSTAGEWSHRTVQTTFLLVPQRGRVLAAKAVAVAALGAMFAAVSAALSAGVLAVALQGLSWDAAPRALAVVVAAGAVFAVIGAGVGAALGNTPAALTSLYLVLLAVMPVLATFEPEIASKVNPSEAVMNLSQGHLTTTSVLILSGWVLVTLAAGAVMTRRRPVQ
ncbi:MAG: conserved rane protein of unknown function [Blastococcus sp.]|jgi:ABC-2 type transport system permease protein|nr:conserved rane protein of unknown function [Blastococcus sp.]